MKFQLISDIHIENRESVFLLAKSNDDKNTHLLVAGDIGQASNDYTISTFLEDASERFKTVTYIMGNHEHYNSVFNKTEDKIKKIIDNLNVDNIFFGSQISHDIDEYSIIAATLWTDINKQNPVDKLYCSRALSDYKYTKFNDSGFERSLIPDDTIRQFEKDKEFIFSNIKSAIKRSRKIIVMTHHAPSSKSVQLRYHGSPLNSAFHSNLDDEIIEFDYDLIWCHGHIHNCSDYMIEKCRVLCNPVGYSWENTEFQPVFKF